VIVRRGAVIMYRQVVVLTIILALANGCTISPSRPPEPNRSEYVISKAAGILFVPEGGAVYGTAFALTRLMERPVYVVALFENPENGASPLRAETTIEPGNLEFLIKSPPLTILTNHRLYTVNLSLYSDSPHTQLLGVHQQQVLFSIPPDMEIRVEKEYGVRVQ
jgi:hypothetical protein